MAGPAAPTIVLGEVCWHDKDSTRPCPLHAHTLPSACNSRVLNVLHTPDTPHERADAGVDPGHHGKIPGLLEWGPKAHELSGVAGCKGCALNGGCGDTLGAGTRANS